MNFKIFSSTNKLLILEKEYFKECNITVETTIEYCETPKGNHFIVTHLNYGDLIANSKIDDVLKRNNNIVVEILQQNTELNPTLTLVYDVTRITNLNLKNAVSVIMTGNKYTKELNIIAMPLGYKQFIAIIAGESVGIINRLASFLPSAEDKPTVLIFKSMEEASATLNLIKEYGI
jgi:hypothetical protein